MEAFKTKNYIVIIASASHAAGTLLHCHSQALDEVCMHMPSNRALFASFRTKPLYELFDMKHFMEGMSSDARPFLQRLTSTQMFCVMIQQWLGRSRTDGHLSFFEECAFAAQNRRAGAVVPCCEQEEAGPRDANNWWVGVVVSGA